MDSSRRSALTLESDVLDRVINSQEFEKILQEISQGKAIFKEKISNRGVITLKERTLELYEEDPKINMDNRGEVTPLVRLHHLRAITQDPRSPFNITIYRKWNPFSAEVAVTRGNTLKFNTWKFSHSTRNLAWTLFHEYLHTLDFQHEFWSARGNREKRGPYYFG